jgi:hypothetical protein
MSIELCAIRGFPCANCACEWHCKFSELGKDRALPSRGTGREPIPDAAGAAKATPVSPVADKYASFPGYSNNAVRVGGTPYPERAGSPLDSGR